MTPTATDEPSPIEWVETHAGEDRKDESIIQLLEEQQT